MQEGEGGPRPEEGVKADTERDGVKEESDVGEIGARAVGEGGNCVHEWMGDDLEEEEEGYGGRQLGEVETEKRGYF